MQSQIKRALDGSFFENVVRALFSSEKHKVATGLTSGGDWTATERRPHEHLSDFVPLSGDHPVIERSPYDLYYYLRSTHSLKTDVSNESQRILNNTSQRKKKSPKEASTAPSSERSKENDVVQVGETPVKKMTSEEWRMKRFNKFCGCISALFTLN